LLAIRRASSIVTRGPYRISAGFAAINVGERLPVSVFHFAGCQEFAQLSTAAGSGECFVQAW
jgi:hypothetical protein